MVDVDEPGSVLIPQSLPLVPVHSGSRSVSVNEVLVLDELLDDSPTSPPMKACSPFCQVGVGHILLGFPPLFAFFFPLLVGDATEERAARVFLGALAATAVNSEKKIHSSVNLNLYQNQHCSY